ncbi:hypothetical protein K2X30_10320 [bacterium]|nr:hypothetical protein [bacterium]
MKKILLSSVFFLLPLLSASASDQSQAEAAKNKCLVTLSRTDLTLQGKGLPGFYAMPDEIRSGGARHSQEVCGYFKQGPAYSFRWFMPDSSQGHHHWYIDEGNWLIVDNEDLDETPRSVIRFSEVQCWIPNCSL